MAFTGHTIWQVQQDGSDTANGGGFDPSQTLATDLAATVATTSSPVVTSASYNFISRDENHWLYIKAGTNWIPGWYKIVTTSGNAATLSAAAGAGVLAKNNGSSVPQYPATVTTATGCATTASPTGGTWTIDYSQSASAGITFTDMVVDGTTNTKFTSSLNPVGKNMVGNIISVTSGITVQRVVIQSVTGTTATCDKALGSLGATGGNGGLGGALATPGQCGALWVNGSAVMIKGNSGDTPFTQTSTSANAAAGQFGAISGTGSSNSFITGYYLIRTIDNTETAHLPILRAGVNSGKAIVAQTLLVISNIIFDNPSAFTSCYAIQVTSNYNVFRNMTITGYNRGVDINGGSRSVFVDISMISCVTGFYINTGQPLAFIVCTCKDCGDSFKDIGYRNVLYACSADNTTTGHAFTLTNCATLINCVAYKTASGKDGFNFATGGSAVDPAVLVNCLAHTCGAYGFNNSTGPPVAERLYNCAGYANGTANLSTGFSGYPYTNIGFVACGSDPLNAVASHDFTLASGSVLIGAGWPSSFKSVVGTNYSSIGMFQPQIPTGTTVGWNPFFEVMGS